MMTPSCSLAETGRNTYVLTPKGQGQNFTSGQGHEVTKIGHVIAYHPMWLEERNTVRRISRLYLFSFLSYLLTKNIRNLKQPLHDSGDLYRGHMAKLSPGLAIRVQSNINQADLDVFEVHMKIVKFLPLTYNWRVTKLTDPR